jgi:hypothetical protein
VRAAESPSRPAAFAPGSAASISDELQVLSALSAIGADLGDPVDVDFSGGKVVVTEYEGIPPQRQIAIRDSVASLPHVAVEFSRTPAASANEKPVFTADSGTAVTPSPSRPTQPSAMQSRLEKQLGGHAEFERFSTQLVDLDDGAMQRVYALRRLAQKFSPEAEAQLSPKDLTTLHEMSRKHADMLAEKVSGMERMLVPALASLGGMSVSVRPAAHAGWQPAAEDIYRNARRVEVLVSQMLGMTPGTPSTSALPADVLAALKDLQANLADCRQFLQR